MSILPNPVQSILRLEWYLGEEVGLPGDNGAETILLIRCLILGRVGGEADNAGDVERLYWPIVGGGESCKWQWD